MSDGISMRYLADFYIVSDPNPSAVSTVACPDCGEFFTGHGRSLKESMADADTAKAKHACPVNEQRTGEEAI